MIQTHVNQFIQCECICLIFYNALILMYITTVCYRNLYSTCERSICFQGLLQGPWKSRESGYHGSVLKRLAYHSTHGHQVSDFINYSNGVSLLLEDRDKVKLNLYPAQQIFDNGENHSTCVLADCLFTPQKNLSCINYQLKKKSINLMHLYI